MAAEATLAELPEEMCLLVLVRDATPPPMALACAIGAYARRRDIEVTALRTRRSPCERPGSGRCAKTSATP